MSMSRTQKTSKTIKTIVLPDRKIRLYSYTAPAPAYLGDGRLSINFLVVREVLPKSEVRFAVVPKPYKNSDAHRKFMRHFLETLGMLCVNPIEVSVYHFLQFLPENRGLGGINALTHIGEIAALAFRIFYDVLACYPDKERLTRAGKAIKAFALSRKDELLLRF